MFDHVKFGVSDYAASKAFFLQALAPLGVTLVGEGEPSYGAELAGSGDASLCLYQSAEKPAPLHIAFRADSREQVDAFWQAALAAGGKDNGAPGLRNDSAAHGIYIEGRSKELFCEDNIGLYRCGRLFSYSA